MGPIYEMAAHLLLAETPFSRNRHFEAFQDPRFRRALALYRRLRALVSDLERARVDGSRLVGLDLEGPRARRTAWLDKPAWEVLLLHPRARAAVSTLVERAA
jgi:hypothetical protein